MTTKKHFGQRVKPKETIGTTIEFVSISQMLIACQYGAARAVYSGDIGIGFD
jgi:hypothetical protein